MSGAESQARVIGPIAAETLAFRVAGRLRQAIYTGELKPAERIVELRVAKQLATGQSTVREALKELEFLGLVARFPNRGSFVVKLSEEEVRQIYEVRSALESLAVELAVQRRSPRAIEDLTSRLRQMKQAAHAKDMDRFIDADFEFHRCLWRAAGNPYLEEALVRTSVRQFAFYRIQTFQGKTSWNLRRLIEKHAQLLKRISGLTRKSTRKIMTELRDVVLAGVHNGSAAQGTRREGRRPAAEHGLKVSRTNTLVSKTEH
jgi:DNA-binding GntR family transcriptional regulator